jgi:hypothetical protein
VQTAEGLKQMTDLQVGDKVLSVDKHGAEFFDDIFFFGHADPSAELMYQVLHMPVATLRLSSRHFLYKCPSSRIPCTWEDRVHTYAKDVSVGDFVWASGSSSDLLNSSTVATQKVLGLSRERAFGAYNPYTLSGSIIVDGAVASAHSDWIFDDLVPASWSQYLPNLYQALFMPGQWLYHVCGVWAARALDMSNPQSSPDSYGRGPQFLAFCLVIVTVAVSDIYSTLSCSRKRSSVGLDAKFAK